MISDKDTAIERGGVEEVKEAGREDSGVCFTTVRVMYIYIYLYVSLYVYTLTTREGGWMRLMRL
jgi:hypothetical protein